MLKIEKTDIYGWDTAIRGMRNPLNSWDKSDTIVTKWIDATGKIPFIIGPNDLKLMKNLSKAGNDHAKFLRMINVTVDIDAPLYWWKEFDTYKVGTVANSCSTMHKLMAKEFEKRDFSFEHLSKLCVDDGVVNELIENCNELRKAYLDFDTSEEIQRSCAKNGLTKKDIWYALIQMLPSSYNQKRTVQLNYQVLKNMYFSRRNHKLDEWHTLCDWMEKLPYFKEVCIDAVR